MLGPQGTLSQVLPGFAPRPAQLELAEQVAQALHHDEILIAEAGTGIGKTFAYLVPALLSGKKMLVSTGTRHLQDQLFRQDLPRLRSALGLAPRLELLKGRSNYLCLLRLSQTQPGHGGEERRLRNIRQWSQQTESGDLAELTDLRDQDPLRPRITSTTENCLGAQCAEYERCFVAKARSRAQDAQLIVVNHHLLCADLALREDGFGELLPAVDAVVVDEAHQFADVLAQFFGFGVSARQGRELCRDLVLALEAFGDMPELRRQVDALADSLAALQHCFPLNRARLEASEVLEDPAFARALTALATVLAELSPALKAVATRGPELAAGWRRCELLQQRLIRWHEQDADELVRWAERQVSGFAFQAIPLDVAPAMQIARERHPGAWIMTSATLAVAGDFRHFSERLGLAQDARTLSIDSPFDYPRHALLYLPPDLPEPNAPGYAGALLREAQPLVEASDGGCFWLCTSQRAVEDYAARLRQWGRYAVLEQGQQERSQLLEAFRAAGNAILVGTSSFWEGVDVRGSALRLVIIDRLPFAAPDDPMLKARSAQLRREGRNPFMEYQVPQAVLTLKQGAGRLIRDHADQGVLMIADMRLQRKPYGRRFIDSLPPMRQSREQAAACQFLSGLRT